MILLTPQTNSHEQIQLQLPSLSPYLTYNVKTEKLQFLLSFNIVFTWGRGTAMNSSAFSSFSCKTPTILCIIPMSQDLLSTIIVFHSQKTCNTSHDVRVQVLKLQSYSPASNKLNRWHFQQVLRKKINLPNDMCKPHR